MYRRRALEAALVALAVVAPLRAGAQEVPGARQADVHNPFSPGYVDMRPDHARPNRRAPDVSAPSFGGNSSSSFFFFGGGSPFGLDYGFYPPAYYPPGYWPPYYYDPYWPGPIVLPPLVVPAETMYGPQALRRFVGVDPPARALVPGPVPAPLDGGFGVLAPERQAVPDRGRVRKSNAEAVARARQYIAFGDEHFRNQKFSAASSRYRKAAAAAPDLADAWFRQGFALAAVGQYGAAARVMRRGLELKPDWANSTFRLDRLYGPNRLAKNAHLENLARAATDTPDDSGMMFLLGVFLYFDGQPDRARSFFVRASDLSIDGADYLSGFFQALAQPQVAADEERQPGRGELEL